MTDKNISETVGLIKRRYRDMMVHLACEPHPEHAESLRDEMHETRKAIGQLRLLAAVHGVQIDGLRKKQGKYPLPS